MAAAGPAGGGKSVRCGFSGTDCSRQTAATRAERKRASARRWASSRARALPCGRGPRSAQHRQRRWDRTAGVGWRAKILACIFHLEGIGAKRCLGRMDGNEWQGCNVIIQFHQGIFTLQAPNGRCAKVPAGALGCFLFLPATPRAGSPRMRKCTNAAAVLAAGSMNSFRYCGSEHNLEPTGVQMASNHLCKIVLRTVDVA